MRRALSPQMANGRPWGAPRGAPPLPGAITSVRGVRCDERRRDLEYSRVVAFATNDILSSWCLVNFAANDILSSALVGLVG